jgi:gluconolactonase
VTPRRIFVRIALRGLALAWLLAAAASAEIRIERVDARFDAVIAPGATAETLATGFRWVEGPVWDARTRSLFFSDVIANVLYRWREGEGAKRFLSPSGYAGATPFAGREPGSNGLVLDPEGRLILCEHGDRRVTRLEPDGRRSVLIERWQGRRLNSPNDVFLAPNGDLYVSDPPFGLPRGFDDPAKELPFQGVYRLRADASRPEAGAQRAEGERSEYGELELLTDQVRAPNGLALSPAGDVLYVANAERANPVWLAFPVDREGRLGAPRTLFDAREWVAQGLAGVPDGLEVDAAGRIFAAAPGGVHVLAPDGTRLGTLWTGVATGNVHVTPRALFVTANDTVYRIPLGVGV